MSTLAGTVPPSSQRSELEDGVGADGDDETRGDQDAVQTERGHQNRFPPREQRLAVALQLDVHGSSAVLNSNNEMARSRFVALMHEARELARQRSGAQWALGELRWDNIRACFASLSEAAECALKLAHLFADPRLQLDHSLPHLPPRIALHVGLVHEPPNAPDGDAFAVVECVEKLVAPGEIWLTEQAAVLAPQGRPFTVEYVGTQNLPKVGTQSLYRISRSTWTGKDGSGGHTVAGGVDVIASSLSILDRGTEAEQDSVLAALADVVDQRACEALLKVAGSPERPFRQRRLALLGLRSHVSPDISKRLVGLLEVQTSEPSRRMLLQLLGHTGDEEVLPAIVKVIENGDASVETREAALLATYGLPTGTYTGRLRKLIANALDDPDELLLVRAAAVAAASLRQDVRLVDLLTRVALNSDFPLEVRAVALEALLSRSNLPALIIPLAADLSEPGPLREPVLDRLAFSRTPEAVEVLNQVTRRGGDPLRGYAAAQLLAASAATTRPRPIPAMPSSWIETVLKNRRDEWLRGA